MSTAAMPQPLQIIADVNIVVNSPAVNGPPFNQGLFTGTTPAIPSYGVNPRCRQYLASTYAQAMIADGFTLNSPEYICMQMYFSQVPAPTAGWVGRRDLTAIGTAIPHVGSAGTGYVVGDLVSVTQVGGNFSQLRVATIGALGAVTGLTVQAGGTGYSVAASLPTTGGSGTILQVDITAIGETPLQAAMACRLASASWYGFMSTTATDADHIAISAWVQSQIGTYYFGTTSSPAALNPATVNTTGTAANGTTALTVPSATGLSVGQAVTAVGIPAGTSVLGIAGLVVTLSAPVTADLVAAAVTFSGSLLTTLYGANSKRTWIQWASTQGGLYPNQIYFTAAVMGCAMAANTQLAGSAFTMKFSAGVPLIGVYTEPLTSQQIQNIEGLNTNVGPNGNVYVNYANAFNVLEQGTSTAQGQFFDEILNLDVLASNIQYNVLNALTSVAKTSQTEPGQAALEQAVEAALALSASTGFIAPGVWEGQTVLGLTPGTSLPTGYKVMSPKYSTQSAAKRQLRYAMPIYVCLIEAGAVHFVTIAVLVQR